ncbi:MAG: hypothetical protein PQJ58_07210 [Spirochaetales bacterium]|nr:hypothetical protein [Spirochaetales bacterium]
MKIRSAALLLFLLSPVLWAADTDWGGKIENISQYSNIENETYTQGNKAGLWLRSSFSSEVNLFARAGYIYRYEKEEHQHIPDISDLYFYGRIPMDDGNVLSYNAGRFRFTDTTSRVLKSVADGFQVKFQNNTLPFTVGAGYTGLVFNLTSEVVMTPADKLESDDQFLLAPPRVLGFAEIKSPLMKGGNSVKLSLIAQMDLRSESKDDYLNESQSGKLHTQYVQLSADGSIVPNLYYSVSGVVQTGQYNIPEYDSSEAADYTYFGGMANLKLDYYVEPRFNTTISLDALYSSGDSWDDRGDYSGLLLGGSSTLHRFVPVSSTTKGYVYAPQMGNLIYGDLSVSVKPVEKVQLLLSAITFMRAVNGPIFDDLIQEDSGDALYLGEEIDFTVNFRPWSDLGFALTSGVFIPNKDIQTEKDISYRIGGYMSVSF